ncbi:MAG: hypothetical protein WC136_08685 [Sphaerochaeta sp.]|nr:hypothetical protein [Sphaerochaeta sp.]
MNETVHEIFLWDFSQSSFVFIRFSIAALIDLFIGFTFHTFLIAA